jgi:hypothetical protein
MRSRRAEMSLFDMDFCGIMLHFHAYPFYSDSMGSGFHP